YVVFKQLFTIFFISSRRRHTRSKRDWSSDVCSSDLTTDTKIISVLSNVSTTPSVTPAMVTKNPAKNRTMYINVPHIEERRAVLASREAKLRITTDGEIIANQLNAINMPK